MTLYEKPSMEIMYFPIHSSVRTTGGWSDDDWTVGDGAFNSSQTKEPEWA